MNDLEHARLLLAMARKELKALEGMQDREVLAEEVIGRVEKLLTEDKEGEK
jgi:hypothetical protein